MRKSGWAAAAGLVSAAMLLTACGGGSSSSSNAGSGGGSPAVSGGSSGSGGGNATASTGAVSTASSGTSTGTGTGNNGNGAHPKASGTLYSPPPGVMYFAVRHSSAGYILTENGMAVYTFAGDSKGHAPTGTSSVWPSVHSTNPQASSGTNLPGTLSTIGGVVTYNGYPLYTYGTTASLAVHPSSQWKLVKLTASAVKS